MYADYRFLWADVGNNGYCSNAQISTKASCGKVLWMGPYVFLTLIHCKVMTDMPNFIVADHAFALRTWLMKSFSGRNLNDRQCIFNYSLFRARRVVEKAFGILANCLRCLLATMAQEKHNVTSVGLACVTLNNIIRTCYRADHQGLAKEENKNHRQVLGAWRQGLVLPDLR